MGYSQATVHREMLMCYFRLSKRWIKIWFLIHIYTLFHHTILATTNKIYRHYIIIKFSSGKQSHTHTHASHSLSSIPLSFEDILLLCHHIYYAEDKTRWTYRTQYNNNKKTTTHHEHIVCQISQFISNLRINIKCDIYLE